MRWRALFLAECLTVGTVLLLGGGWPTIYTVAAILVLPAFILLAAAVAAPRFLAARPKLRYYAHASTAVGVLCWASFFAWYWSNLAEPEIHLLPMGFSGEVVIFFDVPDGAEPKWERGRRIYEIPSSGVLRSQLSPNNLIHRSDSREFFYVAPGGERLPLHDSGAFIAGATSGGAMQGEWTRETCDARYEAYFVTRAPIPKGATAGDNVLSYLREHPVRCR